MVPNVTFSCPLFFNHSDQDKHGYYPQPHNGRFYNLLPFLSATNSFIEFYGTMRDHHQRWYGCPLPMWWLGHYASRAHCVGEALSGLTFPVRQLEQRNDCWTSSLSDANKSSATWHQWLNQCYLCDAANCTSRMKISNNKPLIEASRVI